MLSVYTFVFAVVFRARWGGDSEDSRVTYALLLFIGIIAHGLLTTVMNRAPKLVLSNVNYVKKVVFPLEILVAISTVSALFNAVVSFVVLLVAILLVQRGLEPTVLLAPIVLLPLIFLTMGCGWMLASLGVYLRDIGQTTSILTMVLLFLSPILYPIDMLPTEYRVFIYLNPLTFIIEQLRAVLFWGELPNWTGLFLYYALSLSIMWAGFAWFQRTRKGFADVL